MSTEAWVLTEQHNTLFEIRLNRPDKRNAIQVELLTALADAVATAEKLPEVRLIVIRGEGKAFCAGLDLMAMGGNVERFGADWLRRPHEVSGYWQHALNRLVESPLPSLALIHGYCLGGGLEIALACDFRYAADDAILSLEETRLGIIPDVGGTTRLTQLIGVARAKEMILTGRRIDANLAAQWGLVNRVIAFDGLDTAAQSLAEEISGCAPLAVAAAKRVIQGVLKEYEGLHLERVEQAPLFHSRDIQEGMQAALERRKPQWRGE